LPNIIETTGGFYCVNGEIQHPHGARLAEGYGADYDDLQDWFCAGFGWGQIKHALKTSQTTEEDPAALLQMRADGMGWGKIWQERGLIGHQGDDTDEDDDEDSEEVAPEAKQNNGKAVGKPDNAGQKNKKK
jgi:hypothetical protein